MLSLDSYILPIILLTNIGLAVLMNMGSNIIFGEISYITKAIAAVLQLGVTTDFSIFLYHKYEAAKKNNKSNDEAMKDAIEIACSGKDFLKAAKGHKELEESLNRWGYVEE